MQPPAFAPLPPPIPNKDVDHLRALAIGHYVMAGLAVPLLGFLGLHYALMRTVFANPKMWENAQKQQGAAPFDAGEFFGYFQWFYLFAAACLLTGAILTLLSGRFIARRVNRTFSMVVAGLNCLHFPFGIILGIFTLVVLSRESVARLYAGVQATRP